MTLGTRLKKFIDIVYKNTSEFSDILESSRSSIARYITDSNHPDAKQLAKMNELGMNINWLLNGSGSMFDDNPNGRRLKKIHTNYENKFESSVSERIKYWIEVNFKSINAFAVCTHLPVDKIKEFLESVDVGDPIVIEMLERSGCNTDWALSGDGDLFNDSLMGCLLRQRATNQEECENEINSEFTFTMKQFMNSVFMLSKLHDINKNGINI